MTDEELNKIKIETKNINDGVDEDELYFEKILHLISDLEQTRERLQSAEEALKFYAHSDHTVFGSEDMDFHGPIGHPVSGGKKARSHFEKYSEKK